MPLFSPLQAATLQGWPDLQDVLDFLQTTGLFGPALPPGALTDLAVQAAAELAAAQGALEAWTGWAPLLAVPDTRFFDPPGPEKGLTGFYAGLASMGGSNRLFLGGGLVCLTDDSGNPALAGNPNATLTTGLTASNAAGETLTLGQDFWLRPTSAPQYKKPFTSIEFRTVQYGEPQSIRIAGLWGYAQSLPPAVWLAAVKLAAAALAPQLDLHVNQGRLSRKAGDEEDRFSGGRDSGPVAAAAAQWREDAEKLIVRGNLRRFSL